MYSGSTDSRLNIEVIWPLEPVRNWLMRETALRQSLEASQEQVRGAVQDVLEKFKTEFVETQRILRSIPLLGRIQPVMLSMRGYQFIYILLKTHLEEYFLDQPEDLDMREKWKNFRIDFAHLRYKREPSAFIAVSEFLREVLEKLKLYRMNDQQSLEEVEIIKIFEGLCKNPDLLDLDLGLLLGQGTLLKDQSRKATLSVIDLQQTYYLLVKEVKENFSSWIDLCETLVSPCLPIIGKFQVENRDYHTLFIEGFQKLRALAPVLDAIQINSVEDILRTTRCFEKIQNTFKELFLIEKSRVFGDLQYTIQEIFANPGRVEKILTPEVLGNPSMKQKVLNGIMSAFADANQVHIILEAYLQEFWMQLGAHIIPRLKAWSEKTQRSFSQRKDKQGYQQFLRSIPRVIEITQFMTPKVTESVPSRSREKSLNEALAFIEGTSSSKKNLRKPRGSKKPSIAGKQSVKKVPPQRTQPASIKMSSLPSSSGEAQSSSERVDLPEELSPPSSSLPFEEPMEKMVSMSFEETILETVLQKISEQPLDQMHYLGSSLKQVELAFSSLITAYQKTHRISPEQFESYDYHLMISNMYYLIEQVLRYKNIERDPSSGDFGHHVLRRLRDLGQFNEPKNGIVKKLYSANLWTLYTETQMTSRLRIDLVNRFQRQLEIPPILLKLHRISHAPTPELCVELKNEIEALYQETLAFIAFHFPPVVQEGSSLRLFSGTCQVMLKETSDLEKVVSVFQQKLDAVIGQQMFLNEEKDTLHQGNKSLSFLKRTLKELSSSELTLEGLSPLLRSTIHLTNHVCESIFRVLFTMKHRVDTWEHRLSYLIESSLDPCPGEMRDFFHTHFQGINTDCRYPFDLGKVRSPLHEHILNIESLRKKSDLEESSLLAIERIWEETSAILLRALNFVMEGALPRLQGTSSEASSSSYSF